MVELVIDDTHHALLARLLVIRINVLKKAEFGHHFEVRARLSSS